MIRAKSTAAVQQALISQQCAYFCPHPGLTIDFDEKRVIGCNAEVTLTDTQYDLLQCLAQARQNGSRSGFCSWKKLEKRLPSPYKVDQNDRYKGKTKLERKSDERLIRVQKAVSDLRTTIKQVHPCSSLIQYTGRSTPDFERNGGMPSYRLTSSDACTLRRE